MELKIPSESGAVSLPDCESDPEEQEFSDDDDDRNHKHRRREARSESSERDQPEQFLNRPYRKRGKPFENGHLSKESDPQSHYNLDREFPSKFGQRRPFVARSSQFPSDGNHRFKANQSFSGDLGTGRGRGRNPGSWNQRDSRFTAMDIAPQMGPPVPLPPAVFSGRGLHSVPTAQGSSWAGGFGLIPGMPTGAMDPIHPLGLQGTFRPPLNPSLNMGIPRQRCRDFEERGFCLRGDMCPMEHGVNRIVVEDVQSLSQFNLPATLPSAHLLGNPGGSGLGPPVNASSSALINSKGLSARANKPGIEDGSYTLGGAPSIVVDGSGPDVYDPDQPLWNSDCSQTSTAIITMQAPTTLETESFMEADPSEQLASSSGAAIGLQSTSSSVWGRMNPSKNRLESGGTTDSRVSPPIFPESRNKDKGEIYTSVQGSSHHGKRNNAGELVNSSLRVQNDTGRSMRKPTQKALRTIFVNCIPLKDNKKEALLGHFKKFGEVIDILIQPHSERAFVQFSKREEAERALRSPDAVMGNRFIKLWWANRDNIADDSIVGVNSTPGMHHLMPEASVPLRLTNANTSKENIQLSATKASAPYNAKPPATNGPKVLTEPPVQKKENLEILKEELRKKQEMLERKRNEFRLQLDKLQKHATGTKGEVPEVQAAKKLKVGGDDSPKPLDLHASGTNFPAEGSLHKSQVVEIEAFPSSKTKIPAPMLELSNLKHAVHPLAYVGSPFPTNRYKLDNRPTSFRVMAPLPTEFAKVNALRDHFAVFGDVAVIELEDSEVQGESDDQCTETAKNLSARVSFKTRQAAEKAFINGKSWNGHSLQFTWLNPSKPNITQKEKSPASGRPSGTEIQPPKTLATTNPQESSGERGSSLSAAKDIPGTDVQSVEKSTCDISQDSCGGSQTSAPGLASFSGAEAQSADNSADKSADSSADGSADKSADESSVPSSEEAKGEAGSSDPEAAEKEVAARVEMESDENFKLNEDPAVGDTQNAQEDVC